MTTYKLSQKYPQIHKRFMGRYCINLLLACFLVLLIGCDNVSRDGTSSLAFQQGVSVSWNDDTSTLSVSGEATNNETNIEIHDAADGTLLGMAIVKEDGTWAATTSTPACDIHVTLDSGKTTFAVDNAPGDCTGTAAYARALEAGGVVTSAADLPGNVLFDDNPVISNVVPNAVILSPPQDIIINAGQVVNFQGIAVGTGIQPPFSYYWNFGGAAPNSTIQNPGFVRFDIPGTYFVQLSTSDNLGVPDPTPAVRTITVNGVNSPIGLTPAPVILSPTAVNGSIAVNVGESLFFSGSATDSVGSLSFTYEWDFSGIYPNQFGATAGSIPFTREGTYLISLYATNPQGIRSATPATVTVIVGATAGVNQAPNGRITRPRNDVTINVGESLNFRASGIDPDNTLPLMYSWDFQGVAPGINMSTDNSAGRVTFSTPGIYYITMTVTDSFGASDPNPPIRTVTVTDPNPTLPPPNNGVLSTQIISPPLDLTVQPGQPVFFSGQVLSPAATGPLQYFWDFGGAAVNSNLLTPGDVTFPIPGVYFVTFYATDLSGNVVGTPSSRTVTVADPSNVGVSITSPFDGTTVSIGEAVNLIGQVTNNTGISNLGYRWTIRQRGSSTNLFSSRILNPGNYVFTQPGDYVVRFRVIGTDIAGNRTTVTAKSRITVLNTPTPPFGNPGVASAGMLLPATDMVIYTGNSVDFEANQFTGTNIQYAWDFNGVRSPSTRRNPAPVIFNTPGTYFVTLSVSGIVNGIPLNIFDQRAITVLQQNGSFPPSPIPGTGGSGILLPITDQVINIGQAVDFEANTVIGSNVAYRWDFGGARSPSTRRNPRPVTFSTPGTFLVTLLVTGTQNGLPINIFDQRTITVVQTNGPIPPVTNPVPLGTGILAPTTDTVVNVGGFVDFEANLIPGGNVAYSWNFGGARAPSNTRNPSPIQFNTPGSFLVTLQINGTSNGLPFNMYDQRVITVLQSGGGFPTQPTPVPPIGGASTPQGYISQPAQTTVNVRVGQPVQFAGTGFDPLGVGTLTYQWSFGGARRNIVAQNPGSITFNRTGTYVVSLLVQNAFGQFDSTPPTVVVSVTP